MRLPGRRVLPSPRENHTRTSLEARPSPWRLGLGRTPDRVPPSPSQSFRLSEQLRRSFSRSRKPSRDITASYTHVRFSFPPDE